MHVVFLLTCPQWNDHLRHQTKEEKGEVDEEEKKEEEDELVAPQSEAG